MAVKSATMRGTSVRSLTRAVAPMSEFRNGAGPVGISKSMSSTPAGSPKICTMCCGATSVSYASNVNVARAPPGGDAHGTLLSSFLRPTCVLIEIPTCHVHGHRQPLCRTSLHLSGDRCADRWVAGPCVAAATEPTYVEAIGLRVRTPANRAKSASLVATVAPWCNACAAICASVVRFAAAPMRARSPSVAARC